MADKKISELDELLTADIAATDLIPIVDVSAGSNGTKKVKVESLKSSILQQVDLPANTGQTGKVLTVVETSDGYENQWTTPAEVGTTLPTIVGQQNKVLTVVETSDGNEIQWVTPSASASVGKLLLKSYTADELYPTTSNGCGVLAQAETATNKVNYNYLPFDSSLIEYAFFQFKSPTSLDESIGITFKVELTEGIGASSHISVWNLQLQAQGANDPIDSSWSSPVSVTVTTLNQYKTLSSESSAITPSNTWQAGDTILGRLYRNATDVSDTLSIDARLVGLHIYATANSLLETVDATPPELPLTPMPIISDDNIVSSEEGTTTGWTSGGGSGTITEPVAGKVRFSRTSAAYVNYKAFTIPTTNDVVIYSKFHAANVAGSWGQIVFAAGGTSKFELNFGYNYETSAGQLGTLSAYNYQLSSGNVVATGLTASTDVEVAVHIDRNRDCVSVYYKDATGNWKFGAAFAGTTVFSACDRLLTSASNNAGAYCELDYVIACRPNIVSIGDSITAGHNSFDPAVSFYAGEDNNNTSWQYWAKLYPSLRNNLIVNKGVGGNTSTQILARIAEATAHTPRVVIMQASSNDEAAAISQATRTTNMQSTINAITAASASAVLINGSHATSASSDNTPSPDLRDYMITSWATYVPTLTGVSLAIDTMAPIKDGSNFLASANSSDGIHLNATGAQLLGEYITANYSS